MDERGGFQKFPSKFSCLTVSTKFVVESFSVSLVSGTEIFFCLGGYFHDFLSMFFFSQYRKILWGKPSVLPSRKVSVTKFFWIRGGGGGRIPRFSIKSFLVLQYRNFSYRNSSMFQKIFGIETF